MLVISGFPVNNATAPVLKNECKIDYVSRKVYCFKTMLDDYNKMISKNNITALAQAYQNFMNVNSGIAASESTV